MALASRQRRKYTEEQVEARGGYILDQSGEAAHRRLWDVVEEAWTPAFTTDTLEYRLQKMVFRCTGCKRTDIHQGGIPAHWKLIAEQADSHQGAEATPPGLSNSRWTCSRCEFSTIRGVGAVNRHIQGIQEAPKAHRNAEQILIHRFRLEPPVAPVVSTPVQTFEGALSTGEDGGVAPRQRRRRRRRNRSKASG